MNRCRLGGFGIIEIMIGLAVISILAMMLLPQLVDADLPARGVTSQCNLQMIRNAIQLFIIKEERFPDDGLSDLLTETYSVLEVEEHYLSSIPLELISDATGMNSVTNTLSTSGGWYYDPKTATVSINYNRDLGPEWDIKTGEEKNPSRW